MIETEEDIIRANMLIHGHQLDVKLLELNEKLVDYAVMLATRDDYEHTGFKAVSVRPNIILKDSRVFLNEMLILHKIPYATELLLKLRLQGRIVRCEEDILKKYNSVGIDINPLRLPVKLVDQPYNYGNLSLLTNLSDSDEFLSKMRMYFKHVDLGKRTNQFSGTCYVHEIMHTQVESLKGIVREYYNGELLSIFMELVYSSKDDILLKETIKNRINLFLIEFNRLTNFIIDGNGVDGKWNAVIAGKYIVSTLKAFNLFELYYNNDEIVKGYIIGLVQDVIDGKYTLEEMLCKLDITYDNSLDQSIVLRLINR